MAVASRTSHVTCCSQGDARAGTTSGDQLAHVSSSDPARSPLQPSPPGDLAPIRSHAGHFGRLEFRRRRCRRATRRSRAQSRAWPGAAPQSTPPVLPPTWRARTPPTTASSADAPDSQCYVCLGSSEDGDLSKRHRGVMIHRHCMAAMRAYTRLLKDDERRLRAVEKDPQVGREGYEVGRYIDMWLYSYWYVGIHI